MEPDNPKWSCSQAIRDVEYNGLDRIENLTLQTESIDAPTIQVTPNKRQMFLKGNNSWNDRSFLSVVRDR